MEKNIYSKPLIMAPAGTSDSFLAALSSGADVVYCGLKKFSARMKAKNFSVDDLAKLVVLARSRGVKVYVVMNSILKPNELEEAAEIVYNLKNDVKPDAIIIQDLGFIPLIRQVGFKGDIHLSTLANVTFPKALDFIRQELNIRHIVLPRELNIDEIKLMANSSSKDFELETFVHGALCYAVSGRCYWSSYMGGKSGLRGRCVQPCRRVYSQHGNYERTFSCCDFSLDVLVKVLHGVPKVNLWKIEGRKKGPHYVFYTASAYKTLRDQSNNSQMKKVAINLLNNSLGRYGTHYNFLPQRPQNPIKVGINTSSGLMIGKIKGGKNAFFISRVELLPGDVIRIGYEDQSWHRVLSIGRSVPKKGKLYVKLKGGRISALGAPVFLKDRIEKNLEKMMLDIKNDINSIRTRKHSPKNFCYTRPKPFKNRQRKLDIQVFREVKRAKTKDTCGFWLSNSFLDDGKKLQSKFLWAWLPPVVWPSFESNLCKLVKKAIDKGIRNFVLNMPWQMSFFKKYKFLNIWAGPFCNISNVMSLQVLKDVGFQGAIVTPELHFEDYIKLASESPIPLGIVISGNWPLCISRIVSEKLELNSLFKSPKGEGAWCVLHESNYWIFPDWRLDINDKRDALSKAGFSMFVDLIEPVPYGIKLNKRPGLWNLKLGLK